jgi:sodium/proline symporter
MPLTFLYLVAGAGVLWLLLSVRVQHHTHTPQDFLLARRRLPTIAAELGAAFTHIPLWLLLAIAVAAYRLGAAAVWIGLATWVSATVASLWTAPRLRARAQTHKVDTLAELLTVHTGEQLQLVTRRSIAVIVTLCLGLAMCNQLHWLASSLAQHLDMTILQVLIYGGLAILVCGLLGSFWLAAYTDAALAAVTLIASVAIAVAALYACQVISGNAFTALLETLTTPTQRPPWERTEYDDVLTVAFGVGVAFLASSALAQPAAAARYLARPELIGKQRWLVSAWSVTVVMLALLIGWCARIATSGTSPLTQLESWLSPTWFIVVLAILMCAGITALLNPCITLAGAWAHDCTRRQRGAQLLWYRWAFVAVVVLLVALTYRMATRTAEHTFEPFWLAWHALGASLAPLLIVQLAGKRVRPGSTLGSIWAGFALTLIFHAMPDTTGDLLERAIPFIAAMGIALSGGDQRRNPDRADRGDQTVHDRLSI